MKRINTNLYKKKNSSNRNLSDACPWMCMCAPGIVYLKGGALCATYEFVAPDLDSCSYSKINTVAANFNNIMIQLQNSGNWTIQLELQRRLYNRYPGSNFKKLAGFLIDRQREINFTEVHSHYTNKYYITFTYILPTNFQSKVKNTFIKTNNDENNVYKEIKILKDEISFFNTNITKVMSIVSTAMYVERLDSSKLLTYLHSTVSTDIHPVSYDDNSFCLIDDIITDDDIDNSMPLKLGSKYIPIITVKNFPSVTFPAMLDVLNSADCELRWSTRFKIMQKNDALTYAENTEKAFHAQRKSIMQLAMEATLHTESTRENSTAMVEESDASEAKIEVQMETFGLGFYTSNVMVWSENLEEAKKISQKIQSSITSAGFTVKEEDRNCFKAFCSMMPGNIYSNKRNIVCSTGNVSHVIPISSIWSGLSQNNFMKDICGESHPHVVCFTDFLMHFFLNLNIGGVGHTCIFGRTGRGKSTLLSLLEVQWLKYPNSQVIIFDKGLSARCLTMCCGGIYIEPGKDKISFQPLRDIDTDVEKNWACKFISTLLQVQNIETTPLMRKEIYQTIDLISKKDKKDRTLTTFAQYCNYKDPEKGTNIIADSISPYLLDGQFGSIFDCDNTNVTFSDWTMFEMQTLMEMSDAALIPALEYLFHLCEKKFDGKPTLMVLDEAWIFFKHPVFAAQIQAWLKTLRKLNVFVVFATQEIQDAVKSSISSTIVSQCPTKIYLADDEALTPLSWEIYSKVGLEPSEIKLLSKMILKEDYLYKSSIGVRKFQLGLDKLQLAIMTNSKEDHKLLDEIEEQYGKNTCKELVGEILDKKGVEWRYLMS